MFSKSKNSILEEAIISTNKNMCVCVMKNRKKTIWHDKGKLHVDQRRATAVRLLPILWPQLSISTEQMAATADQSTLHAQEYGGGGWVGHPKIG